MAFKMFQEFPNITVDGWNRTLFQSVSKRIYFLSTQLNMAERTACAGRRCINLDGNGLGRLAVCRSTACI